MKKTIQNRQGKKLAVLVENSKGKNGPVFIAHGLSGNKEQPHILCYKKAFLKNDYTSITWDAANTIGESEGQLEHASLTSYYQDFEDVIEWAKSQSWYQEPFVIVGHSLGGACNILFALKHPKQVKALAPTSAFLSGSMFLKNYDTPESMEEWKRKGYRIEESGSRPGLIKRFKYGLVEDLLTYELIDQGKDITTPVLLMVGSLDTGTTPESQKKFLGQLSSKQKELHIIKEAEHTFTQPKHLKEIESILSQWAKKLAS